MHAGSERVYSRFARSSQASQPVSRTRIANQGKIESGTHFPETSRVASGRGRQADRIRLCRFDAEAQDAAGCLAVANDVAAFKTTGRLQPRKYRSLRPVLRSLRAFHQSDSTLPGFAD